MNGKYLKSKLRLFLSGLLLICGFFFKTASADTGVLIPISEKEEPDPALLSLDRLQLEVSIDHLYARTRVMQIFQSHVAKILEGKYVFALPREALIADFAVWEGVVRIPGVILERRKARNIYQVLRQQAIDPGLLQQAEGEDPSSAGLFSARIVPIPGFGTKRLEMEYTQWLPVEATRCRYVFPLKPQLYRQQQAKEFSIQLSLQSTPEIRNLNFGSTAYPLEISSQTPYRLEAGLDGKDIELTEDLVVQFELYDKGYSAALLSHPAELPGPYFADSVEDRQPDRPLDRLGYFFAGAMLSLPEETGTSAASGESRSVVFLMDTSLSIQWEKLERSCEALFYLLHSLKDKDRFHLALFNRQVKGFTPGWTPATAAAISRAEDFVKSSMIEDGSDIAAALRYGAKVFPQGKGREERYLILITDGYPTLGIIKNKAIAADFQQTLSENPGTQSIRVCPVIIGTDSNQSLLNDLAERHNGFSIALRETESGDFVLNSFALRMGSVPMDDLTLQMDPPKAFEMIYPIQSGLAFPGSFRGWIGRYDPGIAQLKAAISTRHQGKTLRWESPPKAIPKESEHVFLPRSWAKARVDALLKQIEMEGETEAAVEEIIRLSKRYRFVTPYTSFLAAPRALLRPRMIQPGDPILRIRADEAIVSIAAVFPFGLIKSMTYLASEKMWQTRFLAPVEMSDGRYDCKLILRDKDGHSYLERKSFLIDSRPPQLRLWVEKETQRGKTLFLRVGADSDTRRIQARLGRLSPVRLHWDDQQKANIGEITVPYDLPAGRYSLQVTAEDFAHNLSTLSQTIQVR